MSHHWRDTAIAAACAALGSSGDADRPAAPWQSRGPGGGGALFSPAISPHDPNELVMATDMSDVFHSNNFGRSWETVSFRTIQGGVQSQFRFTSDSKIVYAINVQSR